MRRRRSMAGCMCRWIVSTTMPAMRTGAFRATPRSSALRATKTWAVASRRSTKSNPERSGFDLVDRLEATAQVFVALKAEDRGVARNAPVLIAGIVVETIQRHMHPAIERRRRIRGDHRTRDQRGPDRHHKKFLVHDSSWKESSWEKNSSAVSHPWGNL